MLIMRVFCMRCPGDAIRAQFRCIQMLKFDGTSDTRTSICVYIDSVSGQRPTPFLHATNATHTHTTRSASQSTNMPCFAENAEPRADLQCVRVCECVSSYKQTMHPFDLALCTRHNRPLEGKRNDGIRSQQQHKQQTQQSQLEQR